MDADALTGYLERRDTLGIILKKLFGPTHKFPSIYSLGLTSLEAMNLKQPGAGQAHYALLLRVDDAAGVDGVREVPIDDQMVPVVVKGGFSAPRPVGQP